MLLHFIRFNLTSRVVDSSLIETGSETCNTISPYASGSSLYTSSSSDANPSIKVNPPQSPDYENKEKTVPRRNKRKRMPSLDSESRFDITRVKPKEDPSSDTDPDEIVKRDQGKPGRKRRKRRRIEVPAPKPRKKKCNVAKDRNGIHDSSTTTSSDNSYCRYNNPILIYNSTESLTDPNPLDKEIEEMRKTSAHHAPNRNRGVVHTGRNS